MNNTYQISQNIFNSGLQCPTHITQSLNYYFYLPDKSAINSLNLFPLYSFPFYDRGNNRNYFNLVDSSQLPFNYFFQGNYPLNLLPLNDLSQSKTNQPLKSTSNSTSQYSPKDSVKLLGNKRNKENEPSDEQIGNINQEKSEKEKVKNVLVKPSNLGKSVQKSEEREAVEEKGDVKKLDKAEDDQKNSEFKAPKSTGGSKKKKKKYYEELLEDSFLQHIGEVKQPKPVQKNFSIVIENPKPKLKKKNNSNSNVKNSNTQKNSHKKKPDKNAHDMTTTKYQSTKGIFYGDKYKQTSSAVDFMKYNFNFSSEEKYKTKELITDAESQHVDLMKLNTIINNSRDLEDIKPKWLRTKFVGDDNNLKNSIKLVKDICKGSRINLNEEQCLDILSSNNYKPEELVNFKCL